MNLLYGQYGETHDDEVLYPSSHLTFIDIIGNVRLPGS